MRYEMIEVKVTGPTSSGKTALLALIEKAIKDEMGVSCVSPHLDHERRISDMDSIKGPRPERYVVCLVEQNQIGFRGEPDDNTPAENPST